MLLGGRFALAPWAVGAPDELRAFRSETIWPRIWKRFMRTV